MKYVFLSALGAFLLIIAPTAYARRVTNPNPSEARLANLPADHVGVIGKVVRSSTSAPTKNAGEAVVLVEVQKSFGKDAPAVGDTIYILEPGCRTCVHVGTTPGDIVFAGLVGGRGQPFQLSWPRQ